MPSVMMRRLVWLVLLLLLLALFVGGGQPVAVGLFAAPWDKLAHGGYFFALTLLLMQVLPGQWWLGIGIVLLIGAADELHQVFLPGRDAGLGDWLADASGASLALLLHRITGVTACPGPVAGGKSGSGAA